MTESAAALLTEIRAEAESLAVAASEKERVCVLGDVIVSDATTDSDAGRDRCPCCAAVSLAVTDSAVYRGRPRFGVLRESED